MRALLLFLPILFFIACDPDDMPPMDPEPDPEPDTTLVSVQSLLSKVFIDDILNQEYIYDDMGILQSRRVYDVNGDLSFLREYEFIGDTLHRVIKLGNGELLNSYKYYQINNNELRLDYFDDMGEYTSYFTYTDYIEGCGYQSVKNFRIDGMIVYEDQFDYDPNNCNYTYVQINTDGNIGLRGEVVRDDHPLRENAAIFKILYPNDARGIVSRINRNAAGDIIETTSYNATFEYNDDDLPTKEIRTYMSGNTLTYRFEYE